MALVMLESAPHALPISWLNQGRRLLLAVVLIAALAALAAPLGRLISALLLLLLAPGYLVEQALPPPHQPLLVRLCLWLGLSLALVPLVYQWAWAMGLAFGTPLLWAGTASMALATLLVAWRELGAQPTGARPTAAGATALTLVLFAITLWSRFVQIEGLALPPWVDSVHHTLLVRIAAETGAAPVALSPYLPVELLPYHWGYHVLIGTLVRLSGLDPATTVLQSGQVLNALHALTAAGLALALWRRPFAAPVAALVVGLLSLMPAYYLSWGRYTQLTGLLLLPGLACGWQTWLRRGGWGWWAVVVITLAGLSLVHFRILIFGAALLATQALVWAVGQPWPLVRGRRQAALGAGVAAALLTLPWLWLLAQRTLLPNLAQGGLVGGGGYNALNEGLFWVGHMRWLVVAALAGALIGLWRRASATATLLLWVGLLVLLANPWLLGYLLAALGLAVLAGGLLSRRLWLVALGAVLAVPGLAGFRLPYLWLIANDALLISLFLPVALLIAGGAALLADTITAAVGPARRWLLNAVTVVVILSLGLWGTYDLRTVINPVTVLAGPADRAAIAWAAEHTPPEARFLVNSAPWLTTARRGADGGWWLLPLAGRWTTMPPVLYVYGAPTYVDHINELADQVIGYTPGNEQAIFDLIASERISHIYLVDGKGPLQPTLFAGRTGFRQIYAQDGVTIFAVEAVDPQP